MIPSTPVSFSWLFHSDAGSRRRFVQKRSIQEKKRHVAFEEKPEEYKKWIADWKKKGNAKAYYG